jgi:toxin ParE1/3/4
VGTVIVKITESALTDLEDIESYISLDSPSVARKFIGRIFDRIEQLREYPTSGKPLPEIKDSALRELLLNKYRIIYQLNDDDSVNVIRIVHGSRLLDIDF